MLHVSMEAIMALGQRKQRTNVSIDAGLLAQVRELEINVSAVTEAALADAVRRERAAAWARDNAQAIDERRRWIETNGTPLADIQVLKT